MGVCPLVVKYRGSVYPDPDPARGWCFVLAEITNGLPRYRLRVRRTGFNSLAEAREAMRRTVPQGAVLEEDTDA